MPMMFKAPLHHFFADVTRVKDAVANDPKISAPISLAQVLAQARILFLPAAARAPFEGLTKSDWDYFQKVESRLFSITTFKV
jgi:hypothetical protein